MARDAESFVKPYLVTSGKKFRLKDYDHGDHGNFDKAGARKQLADGIPRLADLQERLYAQDKWGVLLIFQAMDAAGKDGAIKHVMSGINPQGCQVFSFKGPSAEDLDHDFLWRTSKALPERGRIGIFNRSYYEEVLVVRVHPTILAKQKLPDTLVSKHIWAERCADIASFERYMARNGYVIRKFFLNVSKREQRQRFLERLTMKEKNWKFSMTDAKEREHWDDYQDAYEDAIRRTATPEAPWVIVPADNKWYARLVVGAAVVSALEDLKLKFPVVDAAKKVELEAARLALEGDGGGSDQKKRKTKKEGEESESAEGERRRAGAGTSVRLGAHGRGATAGRPAGLERRPLPDQLLGELAGHQPDARLQPGQHRALRLAFLPLGGATGFADATGPELRAGVVNHLGQLCNRYVVGQRDFQVRRSQLRTHHSTASRPAGDGRGTTARMSCSSRLSCSLPVTTRAAPASVSVRQGTPARSLSCLTSRMRSSSLPGPGPSTRASAFCVRALPMPVRSHPNRFARR